MPLEKPEILDSTLRDGIQSLLAKEVHALAVEGALETIREIAKLHYAAVIEAGFAGSSPVTDSWIRQASALKLENTSIAAFGMMRKPNSEAADYDANPLLSSLIGVKTPAVVLVAKTWSHLVPLTLNTTLDENLRMIYDTIRHFVKLGKRVIFDAEFATSGFLGSPYKQVKPDFSYTLAALESAVDAGSDTAVLCDTTGILLPEHVPELLEQTTSRIGGHAKVGFHAHNDRGLATVLTREAWLNGATHLQVCMNGIGERTGNASAIEVLAALSTLYAASEKRAEYDLTMAKKAAERVYFITTGRLLPPNTPVAGNHAFATKAGMHLDGNMKSSRESPPQGVFMAYEGEMPENFGNCRLYTLSRLAGAAGLALHLGVPKDKHLAAVWKEVEKQMEAGYDFNTARASAELLYKQLKKGYTAPFKVVERRVEETSEGGLEKDIAMVLIEIGGRVRKAVAESTSGPVDAIMKAELKSLNEAGAGPECILMSYHVNDITPGTGLLATDKVTQAITTFQFNGEIYTTMGVSPSVIDASVKAFEDGITYALLKKEPMLKQQ